MIDLLQFPSDDARLFWEKIYASEHLKIPFLAFSWHNSWYTHLGTGYEPYILTYNHSVLFPFIKKESSVLFSGGTEISDYMDIIGPPDLINDAWENVLKYLKDNNCKNLTLNNIPESSPTYAYFTDIKTRNYNTILVTHEDTTPILSLPKTWDDYLSSLDRKARHELRRKIKKFEREYPGAEFIVSTSPDSEIEILLYLMKLSADKSQFLTQKMEQFFKSIPSSIPEQTKMLLLRVGNDIASAVLYFAVGDSFFLYNSGFDESKFSGSGFYLKAKSVQFALEQGYTSYNFLQGSERYKYELGGKDFMVYRISVTL